MYYSLFSSSSCSSSPPSSHRFSSLFSQYYSLLLFPLLPVLFLLVLYLLLLILFLLPVLFFIFTLPQPHFSFYFPPSSSSYLPLLFLFLPLLFPLLTRIRLSVLLRLWLHSETLKVSHKWQHSLNERSAHRKVSAIIKHRTQSTEKREQIFMPLCGAQQPPRSAFRRPHFKSLPEGSTFLFLTPYK